MTRTQPPARPKPCACYECRNCHHEPPSKETREEPDYIDAGALQRFEGEKGGEVEGSTPAAQERVPSENKHTMPAPILLSIEDARRIEASIGHLLWLIEQQHGIDGMHITADARKAIVTLRAAMQGKEGK